MPTNAQLLVSDEFGSTPSLDGKALPVSSDGVFDLGELAPNTTYHVSWPPNLAGETQALSFTTGTGPSLEGAPDTPEPLDVRRNPSAYKGCRLVRSQGCFDTGAPLRVSFAPREDARAWLVESSSCDGTVRMLWPAECGPPVVERAPRTDARICVSLRATDGVHTSDSTQVICSTPASHEGITRATSGSCTGALLVPSKDDVPCSSDGTSVCVDPVPQPSVPGVSEYTPMAVSTTEVVTDPHSSSGGCSLGLRRARSGGGLLGLALAAGLARARRRRAGTN